MALSTELFEGGGPMILEEPLLDNDMGDPGTPPEPSPAVQRTEFIVAERSVAVNELAAFYDFGENITYYRFGHISEWPLALSPKYDRDAGMAPPTRQ